MFVAYVIVAGVLAVAVTASAVGKLTKNPRMVETYTGLAVPEERLALLAVLLLAGAVGLLVGIAVPAIGVAAAVGLVVYFALAVVTHLRAGDRAGVVTPASLGLLAAATLVLRAATV